MDIKVISTMGLTKDDLHAIEGLSDVAKAEGGFSQDMLLNIDAVSYTHLDVYKRQHFRRRCAAQYL